jgi:anti-sigma regulatory factor (Ser/Thr protein kinase)
VAAHDLESPVFRLRVPATPSSVGVLRSSLRGWLEQQNLEPGEIFDVVLACSESLTLVIDELPRQVALVLDVDGVLESDRLRITTRDYGLWQETGADDTEEPLSVSLMRAFMDSVEFERHPDGRRIVLCKRVTPGHGQARPLLL